MAGGSFLDQIDAREGRWRDASSEAKGISPAYYWTGRGREALEVAYATAASRPGATALREVWKQRHGRAAAPLLVVIGYPTDCPSRASVCGPAGEDPPVVDLDRDHAERLAGAALAEPDRHVAIRFLASALEGDPGEQPGLRNKGLLATHELLYGVPERSDWAEATVSYGSTNKATLNPSSNLSSNTTYTATIKGGSTGTRDSAGNALAQDYSWSFTTAADTTAPRVSTATPTGTGVARGTNAIATFSERMDPATITTSTFKLFRCSSTTSTNCATQVTNVTIARSTDRLNATLNPYGTSSTLLAGRTKYKVVVTTGAKDEAGNQLDQNPSTAGNQNKAWYFTTGSS